MYVLCVGIDRIDRWLVVFAAFSGSFLLGRDLTLGSGLCFWAWAKHENCFDIKRHSEQKCSFLVGHARHDADGGGANEKPRPSDQPTQLIKIKNMRKKRLKNNQNKNPN